MSFFILLPSEIRDLVYRSLIVSEAKELSQCRVHSTAVKSTCNIPVYLLLISRAFSHGILSAVTLLQDIHVEGGSVYDTSNHLVALWPCVVAHHTRRLSVHIRNTLDLRYRRQWKHQYSNFPYPCTWEKIKFLVDESSKSILNMLQITIDLPEVEPVQDFLRGIVSTVASGRVDIMRYKDKWEGYQCTRVEFELARENGQLSLRILLRSRL